MNRSSHILELALKNSGIMNPERGYKGLNYRRQSFWAEETEQHFLPGGTENLENHTGDLDIIENTQFPSTSYHISDPMVINSGNDLIEFKENLRPRLSSCLNPNYIDLESSTEQEPFSAEEPSEYIPSVEEKSISNESEENGIIEDVLHPNTILNIETKCTITNAEQQNKKKKRNMSKKSTPGRKRKRNIDNWKCNLNKKQKNLGLEFTNQRGKLIPKKQMKPGCPNNCPRKCSEKLSLMRSQIFSEFWALGNHNDQVQFVHKCVERLPKKQVVLETLNHSRRQWTYRYSFMINNDKIQVCKKMFFDTLDITDKWVSTIFHKIDKQELQCVSLNDQRGHHINRPNKVSDVIKQSIRMHISQMPVVDSHYVRARSAKKYFDESLTFVKLYQLYKEWLQDNQYEPEIKATERQYREVFYNEFNIDFFKPKKDLCLTCDIYKRASSEEREFLQPNYAFHNASKYVVREFKTQMKSLAQGSNSVVVACYDLQKILSTPMSEVSAFYYKRKLAVYNLTVFDLGENEGMCYVWDETIGKKGANEISSAVYLFIERKAQKGMKDFYFFSDSCAGQNKNRIVFAMYSYAVEKFNINITHVFFEVGHSQNEGDAMHSLIERRKKNQVVYVPDQWVTLIRCAKITGKPYTVTELDQNKILNFKQLKDSHINFELDLENNKIKWAQIKHLKIQCENPKLLHVNYDVLSETMYYIDIDKKPINKRSSTRKSTKENTATTIMTSGVPPAYFGSLRISKAKYNDLNSLCTSNSIPELYHQYYKNLKYDDKINMEQSDSE